MSKILGVHYSSSKVLTRWTGSLTAIHDTDTKLTLASVSWDRLIGFTWNSGLSRLECNVAGQYNFTVSAKQTNVVDAALNRQQITKIYKGGSLLDRAGYIPGIAGDNVNSGGTGGALPESEITTTITLAVGEYLEFYFYQANGSGLSRTISAVRIAATKL